MRIIQEKYMTSGFFSLACLERVPLTLTLEGHRGLDFNMNVS